YVAAVVGHLGGVEVLQLLLAQARDRGGDFADVLLALVGGDDDMVELDRVGVGRTGQGGILGERDAGAGAERDGGGDGTGQPRATRRRVGRECGHGGALRVGAGVSTGQVGRRSAGTRS